MFNDLPTLSGDFLETRSLWIVRSMSGPEGKSHLCASGLREAPTGTHDHL